MRSNLRGVRAIVLSVALAATGCSASNEADAPDFVSASTSPRQTIAPNTFALPPTTFAPPPTSVDTTAIGIGLSIPVGGCTINGQQIFGNIYVASSSLLADASVYQASSALLADMTIVVEDSGLTSNRCGYWHFVSSSILADFTIYFTTSSMLADASVYLVQ